MLSSASSRRLGRFQWTTFGFSWEKSEFKIEKNSCDLEKYEKKNKDKTFLASYDREQNAFFFNIQSFINQESKYTMGYGLRLL